MSKDLQLLSIVDDLEVLDVSEVEGANLRTIRLQGRRGFVNATRIDINGRAVDDFTIVSDTVLLVLPGDALDDTLVSEMQVIVYSSVWSGQQKVRLLFALTHHSKSVSGLQSLIQKVVKVLLGDSGSNRYATEDGGGLLRGLVAGTGSRGQAATIIAQAINVTEANITAAQSSASNLSLNEKLLRLQLLGVDFVGEEIRPTVRLQTMAGSTVDLPLTI